jgi:hypothetical protein
MKTSKMPQLSHRLITLRVPNDVAAKLDRIALRHDQTTPQFLAGVLKPLLSSDADESKWWSVVSLPPMDFMRLDAHRRAIRESGGKRLTQAALLEIVASERLRELEP